MGVLLGIVGGACFLWLWGRTLPVQTVVTRSLQVGVDPLVVFQVIDDIQGQTQWLRMLRLVDPLPSLEGRRVWRESNHGGTSARYEELEVVPAKRILRRIGEPGNPAHVLWDAKLVDLSPGTRVEVTETSYVANPLRRLRQRYFVKTERILVRYLTGLGRRLGDDEPLIS